MKNSIYILLFSILFSIDLKAQVDPISFTYDASGNRVKRGLGILPHSAKKGIKRDAAMDSCIKLFPNPVADVLTIRLENYVIESPVKITVYDLTGRVVFVQNYSSPESSVDLSKLRAGTYILILKRDAYENSWKIVKTEGAD